MVWSEGDGHNHGISLTHKRNFIKMAMERELTSHEILIVSQSHHLTSSQTCKMGCKVSNQGSGLFPRATVVVVCYTPLPVALQLASFSLDSKTLIQYASTACVCECPPVCQGETSTQQLTNRNIVDNYLNLCTKLSALCMLIAVM